MEKECSDCSHNRDIEPRNYCYMFEKKPKVLPCGQHDKFKKRREMTGKLIIKHPEILALMIRGMGGDL